MRPSLGVGARPGLPAELFEPVGVVGPTVGFEAVLVGRHRERSQRCAPSGPHHRLVDPTEPMDPARPVEIGSRVGLGADEHAASDRCGELVGDWRTVQWSTTNPSRAAGMPSWLSGVAMRRSQATTTCVPAPSAGPSMAASTGA